MDTESDLTSQSGIAESQVKKEKLQFEAHRRKMILQGNIINRNSRLSLLQINYRVLDISGLRGWH